MNMALLLVALSILVALLWGGSPERYGALALIEMTALKVLGLSLFDASFDAVDPIALIVDLVGLVCYVTIAVYSMRLWPLWAAALQAISLSTHLVRDLEAYVRPQVYWIMKNYPTLAICALLIGATLLHRLRMKKGSASPFWRDW